MGVNIKEYFSSWEMIRDGIDKCKNPEMTLPLICTALDYVAMKNNMSTLELLKRILPAIKSVNEFLGNMES